MARNMGRKAKENSNKTNRKVRFIMSDKITSIFGAGVPTAPDVQKIIDETGVPNEGQIVKYSDIERVIGIKRRTSRFGTVAAAWKRRLKSENDIVMCAVENIGYKALTPSERITYSGGKIRSGVKSIKVGSVVASTTDRKRLSDDEKSRQEKYAKAHAILTLAERSMKKLPEGV